jgi:hypothetical protein
MTLSVEQNRQKASFSDLLTPLLRHDQPRRLKRRLYLYETRRYNAVCHNGKPLLLLGTARALYRRVPRQGVRENIRL